MSVQLTLDPLKFSALYSMENFYWSPSNTGARDKFFSQTHSPHSHILLQGTGRSHLAHAYYSTQSKALLIDLEHISLPYLQSIELVHFDVLVIDNFELLDRLLEKEIFYILNDFIIRKKSILVAAKELSSLDILPDIKTRLQQFLTIYLKSPVDNEDIKTTIQYNLSYLQIDVKDAVLEYCITHIDRNLKNLMKILLKSINEEKKITIQTIKDICLIK